jgi:hypothetical protein
MRNISKEAYKSHCNIKIPEFASVCDSFIVLKSICFIIIVLGRENYFPLDAYKSARIIAIYLYTHN